MGAIVVAMSASVYQIPDRGLGHHMILMIGMIGGKLMVCFAEITMIANGLIRISIVRTMNWTLAQLLDGLVEILCPLEESVPVDLEQSGTDKNFPVINLSVPDMNLEPLPVFPVSIFL